MSTVRNIPFFTPVYCSNSEGWNCLYNWAEESFAWGSERAEVAALNDRECTIWDYEAELEGYGFKGHSVSNPSAFNIFLCREMLF